MNWIRAHIDDILLWLFCWAGTSDIVQWWFYGDSLRLQVGALWLIVGFVIYWWRDR